MNDYIYKNTDRPKFHWDSERLTSILATVRNKQGRLIGRMESLGFDLKSEATLNTLTLDIIKSNEIEGKILNPQQVRSSLARRLGMEIGGLVAADRNIDGVVEMTLDATQKYRDPLTSDRLFGWHSCMFSSGRSGMYKITVGNWRTDIMQVVSGGMGHEKILFEAPSANTLEKEMKQFFDWFNSEMSIDPVLNPNSA